MRLMLAGAFALAVLSPAQAAEDEYTVKLTPQEWGVVGQALGEVPYRSAAPVVDKIRAQMRQQDTQRANAAKPAEPVEPEPKKE